MSLTGWRDPLAAERSRPAAAANLARNELRKPERSQTWEAARDAARRLLGRHVPERARVAVLGAGNGDDLPLEWLASRAGELALLDLDARALRGAVGRLPPPLRSRVRIHRCEVTAGAADRITRAVREDRRPRNPQVPRGPLAGGGYDVVIGDLLYSQLLYPGLLDAGISGARTGRALARYSPDLTDGVVARMQASAAPGGRVIHLHDMVGWWEGHPQPVALGEILGAERPEDALALAALCRCPLETDPHRSVQRLGTLILDTALWEWPFAPGASYLIRATVTTGALGTGR